MNKGYIYKLNCPDGYFYIGSTTDYLSRRIGKHKSDSKIKNNKLYNHINKFKWDFIKIIIIDKFDDINIKDLLNKEYELINKEYSEYYLNEIINNKLIIN